MLRILFASGLGALHVTGASAQMLPVQAGEHAGFTRLVLPIGTERTWTLDAADDVWRLELSPAPEGFDLSRSFDLIPRTRVASMQQDGAGLEIRLGCPCDVSPFRYQGRFLVLDISEPSAESGSPPAEDTVSDDSQGQREEAERRRAAAAALPDLARVLTGEAARPPVTTGALGTPGTSALPAPRTAPAVSDVVDDSPSDVAGPADRLEEAARIMAEQLARAAASGLLEAAPEVPLDFADPVAPTDGDIAEPREADTARTTDPVDPQPRGTPHPPSPVSVPDTAPEAMAVPPVSGGPDDPLLRARTAFDVAAAPRPASGARQRRLACTGEAPGIMDWSDSSQLHEGLGVRRLALYDDRDQLNASAVIDLARHYLYHGFGAEAVFWLSRLDAPPEDLVAMGRLVDGTHDADYPQIEDDVLCSDEEFLLRYLSGAAREPLLPGQVERLQIAFAALPAPLRGRFGPDFATRLSDDGHSAAARNIRDMVVRSGIVSQPVLVALDMDLGIASGGETLRENLSVALRDDGATPASTMARALAQDRIDGRRPDPARLIAAEALLRETPPGREADRLWREVVVSRATMGQVDTAISMLAAAEREGSAVWQGALTDLVADRVRTNDTAALLVLAHLFGGAWTAQGSESGRARTAAAARLRDAGLHEAAVAIEVNGPRLILPRDEQETPPLPSAADAWAAGNWRDAANLATGPHAEVAARMAALESGPEDRSGPPSTGDTASDTGGVDAPPDLDRLARTIADSRALRDEIEAILSAPVVAADGLEPRR